MSVRSVHTITSDSYDPAEHLLGNNYMFVAAAENFNSSLREGKKSFPFKDVANGNSAKLV